MAPLTVQEWVSGWQTSAELVAPPATSKVLSWMATRTCPARDSNMGLAGDSVPSYSNYPARDRAAAGVRPPVRKERPSGRAAEQAALGGAET